MENKLVLRYSSISTFIKNREMYEKLYVLKEYIEPKASLTIGQACHILLLEKDKFDSKIIVGGESKHPYQKKFCELMANKEEDEYLSEKELTDICTESGYAASSSKTKWKELLEDSGIIILIKNLREERKTGVKKIVLSETEYIKIKEVVNKLENETMYLIDKDGKFFCTNTSIKELIGKSQIEKDLILEQEDLIITSKLDQIFIDKDQVHMIDYKFVNNVDIVDNKDIENYLYNIQACIYSKQLFAEYKDKLNLKDWKQIKCTYVIIEKSYPYRVRFMKFSEATMEKTEKEISKIIVEMKKCHQENNFIDINKKFSEF